MLPFQAEPGQFGPEAKEPGLLVWRVEKMKAVLLEPSAVGAFYNGDSYLVLDNRGELGADIHMWIGERGPEKHRGPITQRKKKPPAVLT